MEFVIKIIILVIIRSFTMKLFIILKKNSLDEIEVINVYKSTSYNNESQSFESANTDSKFNAISIYLCLIIYIFIYLNIN